MAGKAPRKNSQKDNDKKRNRSRHQDIDVLDLRDEILDLKREIAAVRKERDRLLIRLRKCEEEARRKDKQIEQLMDPTQNAEIRRLLSMKGAALLMNLKEQNNTLVQIVMNKDHQIRRLLSEVKTAKTYCKTSKTEPYRAEISRLRMMLIQSQEALKEAAGSPPTSTLMCTHGHSSSSSDRTSPRELEELRFTIQSLETLMKYSKELLGKKNREITVLNKQLQNILEGHQCNNTHELDWRETTDLLKFDSARRCTSASLLELFQTPLLKSPCSESARYTIAAELSKTPRRSSMPMLLNQVCQSENILKSEKELLRFEAEVLSHSLKGRKCRESQQNGLTANTGPSTGERKKSFSGRDKWKCALKKLRNPSRRKKLEMKKSQENTGTFEADAEKRHETFPRKFENKALIKANGRRVASNWRADDVQVWTVLEAEMARKSSVTIAPTPLFRPTPKARKFSLPASLDLSKCQESQTELQLMHKQTPLEEPKQLEQKESPEAEKQEESEIQTIEVGEINAKTFRTFYRRSVDSSFDSESGARQEAKSFEVEVEINACPSLSSLCSSPEKTKNVELAESFCEREFEDVFDDDDDVVTI